MQVMLELKRRKTVKIVKKWKNVTQNMPNLEIFSERSLYPAPPIFSLHSY